MELQDTLEEYRSSERDSQEGRELRAALEADQRALEQHKQEMEAQLQQLFTEWDQLQDHGEATSQTRVERDRVLKQIAGSSL